MGAGRVFDAGKLSPELKVAIEAGMTDAWIDLAAVKKRIDVEELTSGEMFGTREFLKNN